MGPEGVRRRDGIVDAGSAQLGSGRALSAGDLQFTYDWEGGGWVSLPLGFQIGVVRRVGGQPLRFALNPQVDLADIKGAVESKLVFTVTLLAPAT